MRAAYVVSLVGVGIAAAVSVVMAVGQQVQPVAGPPEPTAASISEVDWTRTSLDLPRSEGSHCPVGRTRLNPTTYNRLGTVGESPADADHTRRAFQVLPIAPAIGDLTGDGHAEAVLHVRCPVDAEDTDGQDGNHLLVVRMRPDHSLEGMAYIGPTNAGYGFVRVADGKLAVQLRYSVATLSRWGGSAYDVAYVSTYRLSGSRFEQVGGRASPLLIRPEGMSSAVQLPEALVRFHSGEAVVGSTTYEIRRDPFQVVDVDGDGNEEILVVIHRSVGTRESASLYLLGQARDGFVTLDVPVRDRAVDDVRFGRRTLTVMSAGKTLVMRWDGRRFRR